MLRYNNNTQNLQSKLGQSKKPVVQSLNQSKKDSIMHQTVGQKRVLAPTNSRLLQQNVLRQQTGQNREAKFTNSANQNGFSVNKRKDKQLQKEHLTIQKENKRTSSILRTKSKSRVRFEDSDAKENTDCKSIRTAASTRLTTSDKNQNNKKRPPICSVDRYFNSPFSSNQKRQNTNQQQNSCGKSTKVSSFDAGVSAFTTGSAHSSNYQTLQNGSIIQTTKAAANRLSVNVSSFSQLPILKEDKRFGRASMLPGTRPPMNFAPKIKHQTLKLEDKCSGMKFDFNLYHDKDLPFMNATTDMGTIIRKTIIDGDVDDDCQTDEEQRGDAKGMLRNELAQAINKYLADKKDGTTASYIKNINAQKRFAKTPFNQQ